MRMGVMFIALLNTGQASAQISCTPSRLYKGDVLTVRFANTPHDGGMATVADMSRGLSTSLRNLGEESCKEPTVRFAGPS